MRDDHWNRITPQTLRKELRGQYSAYIVIIAVFAAVAVFCTVFCGTQLGWGHPFTVIGLAACGISLLSGAFVCVKLCSLRRHRLFRKYGTAETIAANIMQGLQAPQYIDRMGSGDFVLLLTDRFIVSGGSCLTYTELRDIRRIQPVRLQDPVTVSLGGDLLTTAVRTAGVNYAARRYRDANGITEQTRYDMLHITDDEGVSHDFSVRRADMDTVLQKLKQLAPQAEITSAKKL